MMHDYRVMNSERGYWCMNEVHIGLRFRPWMLDLLNFQLSPYARTDALVMGRKFTAEEAKTLGIVQLTATEDDLIKCVERLVASVLPSNKAIDRSSLHIMKCDVYQNFMKSAEAGALRDVSSFNPNVNDVNVTGSKL